MNAQSEKFLHEIQDENADVRFAAWVRAGEVDPEVIPELGKLLTGVPPGVRRAADEALKSMVHAVGKDPASAKRPAVIKQLIGLTGDGHPLWTRTLALRHLSLIGGDETVAPAAKLLRNTELQEEAVFCLERIPGKAATEALMAALSDVGDAFKPRVLAALGHRRDETATEVCAGLVMAKNLAIATAAMRAVARIGKRPEGQVRPPDFQSLSGWQKVDYVDSGLRYAGDQVRRGNTAEALRIYRMFADNPAEHVQCAVVIGLSQTKSPEAAAIIAEKRNSPNRTVRITAEKAQAAMGKIG